MTHGAWRGAAVEFDSLWPAATRSACALACRVAGSTSVCSTRECFGKTAGATIPGRNVLVLECINESMWSVAVRADAVMRINVTHEPGVFSCF